MSMFDSYNNMPDNYIPNNTITHSDDFVQLEAFPPYKRYINDKFLGFYWYQGDEFTFAFTPNITISVDEDSIILYNASPSQTTQGILNQKAYDLTNLKSWTCTTTINGNPNWEQDAEFIFPKSGKKQVSLNNTVWFSTTVRLDIENFRREIIHTNVYHGNNSINISIDSDLADTLIQGNYHFKFTIEKYVNEQQYFILNKEVPVAILGQSQKPVMEEDFTNV